MVRIAIDLKLFSILKEGEKALGQLIETKKAERVLLSRSSKLLKPVCLH